MIAVQFQNQFPNWFTYLWIYNKIKCIKCVQWLYCLLNIVTILYVISVIQYMNCSSMIRLAQTGSHWTYQRATFQHNIYLNDNHFTCISSLCMYSKQFWFSAQTLNKLSSWKCLTQLITLCPLLPGLDNSCTFLKLIVFFLKTTKLNRIEQIITSH